MVKKKWVIRCSAGGDSCGHNPIIEGILQSRGIDTIEKQEKFLNSKISDLYDPYLLKDMDKAVERINLAIANNEKIVVYGDYDVDGITSVSILYLYLKNLTNNLSYYIPDRKEEGYGINEARLAKLIEKGTTLLITVDCGITAISEIEYAKQKGLDVIVTDHHKCSDNIPQCVAVVNPKRSDCLYPFKELAGVGVTFKLLEGLSKNSLTREQLIEKYSEIVALGTVADIVPLVDENRIFVKFGLEKMKNGNNKGIKGILEVASIAPQNVNSGTLGFQVAPRINAAGRLDNANIAVELFVSEDYNRVLEIASYLSDQNEKRQKVEHEILDEVKEILNNDPTLLQRNTICLAKEGWHNGVIGIVASRITEEYNKPCILIAVEGNLGKGSLRSIKGFNIYAALEHTKEYLKKFGGHELAAGLTIDMENFHNFRESLEEYSKEVMSEEMFIKEVKLDAELPDNMMTIEFVKEIEKMEPFGMGNPQPLFLIKKAKLKRLSALKEGKHLKATIQKKDKYIDVIGFSLGEYAKVLKQDDIVAIAGNIYINNFRGESYFSIKINDIRLS